MANIPSVKTWRVRVLDDSGQEIHRCNVMAPTKYLARLNHRHGSDPHSHYKYWGFKLVISPVRRKV